jgi:hypothetical protein
MALRSPRNRRNRPHDRNRTETIMLAVFLVLMSPVVVFHAAWLMNLYRALFEFRWRIP